MRPAFSMITAIIVMILMATVGAFIINLSGKLVQETTTQYRREQAILYAKSYTEYAILAATAKKCIRNITSDIDGTRPQTKKGQGYHIYVHIEYLGKNSTCSNHIGNRNLTYPDSAILVDTYVYYRDPESTSAQNSTSWSTDQGYTYHRRTIQLL
jgi:hypothetical protein